MADPSWFVVEDGSGDPDATAYLSLEEADLHHNVMGNDYWDTLEDIQQYQAIARATAYIDKRFGQLFRGTRMQKDQALAWPRLSAFDDDEFSIDDVPKAIKRATAEYALRAALYNVLAPDPQRPVPAQDMGSNEPNSASEGEVIVGPIRSKTEKVGPIEKSVVYEANAQLSTAAQSSSRVTQSNIINDLHIPEYPEADMLIEPLLMAGGSVKLERA